MAGQRVLELFALLTLLTLGTLAQSQSLVDVLRQEGFTVFADLLTSSGSGLLNGTSRGLIVYAPTNAALSRRLSSSDVLRRAVEDEEAATSYQIAQDLTSTGNAKRKRGSSHNGNGKCSDVSGPGAVDYMTLLDDPDFVNLPPNNNASIVQKNMPKAALPVVHSGLGDTVKVTGLDIPFDRGVIRPVSGLFTLPRLLSFTLPFLGTDKVLGALQSTGLIRDLDNRTGITFLAPDDRVIPSNVPNNVLADILRQHTLIGPPIFTSDLKNGDTYKTLAGTSVTVTVQCGDVFINGARILAGDAIIKNGVVHTVDRLFDPPLYVTTTQLRTATETTTRIIPTVETVLVPTTWTSIVPPPPPQPPATVTVTSIIPAPPPLTVIHTVSAPPYSHPPHSLPPSYSSPRHPPLTYTKSTLVTHQKPPTTEHIVHGSPSAPYPSHTSYGAGGHDKRGSNDGHGSD